jgi:hypothetical protein
MLIHLFVTDVRQIQVSSVTDHVGSQDTTTKSADFDDDEGGLVSFHLLLKILENWLW